MESVRSYLLNALVLVCFLLVVGCTQTPEAAAQPEGPRLRITNTSGIDLDQVVVIFPDERITFGPLAAGATSDYQPVRHGVYGYAAYEVTFDGQTINQPVLDWMGATPLQGEAFTYAVTVDPEQPRWQMVQGEVT